MKKPRPRDFRIERIEKDNRFRRRLRSRAGPTGQENEGDRQTERNKKEICDSSPSHTVHHRNVNCQSPERAMDTVFQGTTGVKRQPIVLAARSSRSPCCLGVW